MVLRDDMSMYRVIPPSIFPNWSARFTFLLGVSRFQFLCHCSVRRPTPTCSYIQSCLFSLIVLGGYISVTCLVSLSVFYSSSKRNSVLLSWSVPVLLGKKKLKAEICKMILILNCLFFQLLKIKSENLIKFALACL